MLFRSVATAHWTAILTVKMVPPRTADTLRKNPLGIYVDAIAWSREFETAPPQPAIENGNIGVVGDAATSDPASAATDALAAEAAPAANPQTK